ncbi:hypothetical protein FPSE_04037 [Fusarium pseudograminearum CS3096]|uniref:Rhodopsin domain-containing protein n=1 Tax=Fusarium pseudograminearum (strain CS3096) TaxID=1028729 RepID=K3VLR2_FUSPC|nr:hypothetical protein FPSE_04037 [Fusarium pseudograminearum CS3096]EKJ75857.1 hypothetical protein FPSE_04037 [Fusarium pseudograminearum CS3096]KAF0642300.1 hypothetical protein FPSE5266_04037 [Fusarium pseudograminearum]
MVKSLAGLTGENIAKIAYAQHSISPSGMGAVCEVLIYVFLAICTIVVGLRVYVRMFRVQNDVKWRLNDYLAVAGFLPYIPAAVLGALSVHYGVGASDAYLNHYEMRNFITVRGMEYLIFYELIYYASSTITKFAIAVTILYICVERRYKYIMYGIMCIMTVTAVICVVWFFVNCVPFQTYWNPGAGKCKSANGFLYLSYIGTSAQVASDWACAMTPFFIVYSLQMPTRSKLAVVGILGLGLLASIAALMRMISYKYIEIRKYPHDHMEAQGRLLFWSLLESSLAIIACSLPSLKVFGTCLAKTMTRSKGTSRPKLEYVDQTPMHSLSPHGHARTTVSIKGNWDRLHDDDSSGRHIMVESQIHIDTSSRRGSSTAHSIV